MFSRILKPGASKDGSGKKPTVANLGNSIDRYYDAAKGRWVKKGEPQDSAEAEVQDAPPPPASSNEINSLINREPINPHSLHSKYPVPDYFKTRTTSYDPPPPLQTAPSPSIAARPQSQRDQRYSNERMRPDRSSIMSSSGSIPPTADILPPPPVPLIQPPSYAASSRSTFGLPPLRPPSQPSYPGYPASQGSQQGTNDNIHQDLSSGEAFPPLPSLPVEQQQPPYQMEAPPPPPVDPQPPMFPNNQPLPNQTPDMPPYSNEQQQPPSLHEQPNHARPMFQDPGYGQPPPQQPSPQPPQPLRENQPEFPSPFWHNTLPLNEALLGDNPMPPPPPLPEPSLDQIQPSESGFAPLPFHPQPEMPSRKSFPSELSQPAGGPQDLLPPPPPPPPPAGGGQFSSHESPAMPPTAPEVANPPAFENPPWAPPIPHLKDIPQLLPFAGNKPPLPQDQQQQQQPYYSGGGNEGLTSRVDLIDPLGAGGSIGRDVHRRRPSIDSVNQTFDFVPSEAGGIETRPVNPNPHRWRPSRVISACNVDIAVMLEKRFNGRLSTTVEEVKQSPDLDSLGASLISEIQKTMTSYGYDVIKFTPAFMSSLSAWRQKATEATTTVSLKSAQNSVEIVKGGVQAVKNLVEPLRSLVDDQAAVIKAQQETIRQLQTDLQDAQAAVEKLVGGMNTITSAVPALVEKRLNEYKQQTGRESSQSLTAERRMLSERRDALEAASRQLKERWDMLSDWQTKAKQSYEVLQTQGKKAEEFWNRIREKDPLMTQQLTTAIAQSKMPFPADTQTNIFG